MEALWLLVVGASALLPIALAVLIVGALVALAWFALRRRSATDPRRHTHAASDTGTDLSLHATLAAATAATFDGSHASRGDHGYAPHTHGSRGGPGRADDDGAHGRWASDTGGDPDRGGSDTGGSDAGGGFDGGGDGGGGD